MNPQPDAMYKATDNELLMRFVKAKDEKCFETIVSRHSNLVYQVCHTVLLNSADAEDAFQATFVVLIRKAKCLLTINSLAAWLYKVAHRISVRANQKKRKQNHSTLDFDPEVDVDQFHKISKKEILSRVFDELASLPNKYKDVLVECYLQGKSYRQVAESSDTTETVIKGRMAQAKKTLRQRLLKRGIALSFVLVMLEQVRSVTVANSLVQSAQVEGLVGLISESTAKVPMAIQSLSKIGIQRMSMQLLTKPFALVIVAIIATVVPISMMMNHPVQAQDGGIAIKKNAANKENNTVFKSKSNDPFAIGSDDAKPAKKSNSSNIATQQDPFAKPRNDDPFSRSSRDDPFGAPSVSKSKKPVSRKVPFATGEAAEKKIEEALEQATNFDFVDTPLIDVAEQLSLQFSIAVHVDRPAIEDAGYQEDIPINGRAQNRTLRSSLSILFDEYDFAFVIKNETLIITTEDAIADSPEDYLVSRLYDVSELLNKDPDSIVTTIQQSIDPGSIQLRDTLQ